MEKNDEEIEKMATIYSCRCSNCGDWNRKCDGVSHPSTPDQAITKETPNGANGQGWIDRFLQSC